MRKNNPSEIKRREAMISEKSPFNVLEAYKAVRTNLIFSLAASHGKKVLITSSEPSEGKTITTVNLAITMAQTGARVLIIDADLRKPQIKNVLNLDSIDGLSTFLGGFEEDMKKIIHKTAVDNLWAIPSGTIPPNPTELLSSDRMSTVLDYADENFDYILIDTPPINLVTDVTILTTYKIPVLFVVKEQQTRFDALNQALGSLQLVDTKPIGFIYNGANEKRSHYKYKNKYGYKYSYIYK